MMKGLSFFVVLIAIGCLSITFSMTRDFTQIAQWVLLSAGIVINFVSLLCIYYFLKKIDAKNTDL